MYLNAVYQLILFGTKPITDKVMDLLSDLGSRTIYLGQDSGENLYLLELRPSLFSPGPNCSILVRLNGDFAYSLI